MSAQTLSTLANSPEISSVPLADEKIYERVETTETPNGIEVVEMEKLR